MVSYKDSVSLSERISKSNNILTKYPYHVPVILELKDKLLSDIIKKRKYLIPRDTCVSYILCLIREKMTGHKEKGLFMYCNDVLLCPTTHLGDVYENYKRRNNLEGEGKDKFLYITVAQENTFGYKN